MHSKSILIKSLQSKIPFYNADNKASGFEQLSDNLFKYSISSLKYNSIILVEVKTRLFSSSENAYFSIMFSDSNFVKITLYLIFLTSFLGILNSF